MKKILIYGLSTLMLASSAMTFTGCIDETEPTSGATAEQVEQNNADNILQILRGSAAYLCQPWTTSYHWGWGYGAIMHIRDLQTADMAIYDGGRNYHQFWYWYENQGMGREYAYAQFQWEYQMGMVNMANKAIAMVDPETADDELKGYLGAALAFRAMTYLDMAREYEFLENEYTQPQSPEGNPILNLTVPIVKETTTEEEARNNPRASKENMAAFILEDLNNAEQYISNLSLSERNMPHLDCVYGLKARLYMWLGQYADAKNYARKAIDEAALSGIVPMTRDEALSTITGFNDITKWMWGAQYTTGNVSNLLCWTAFAANEAVYGYCGPMAYGSTDTFSMIDANMYDRISDTDWRKLEWKAPATSPLNGQNAYIDEGVGEALQELTSLKFRPNSGNITDYTIGNVSSFPLMRVEEMYFIEAEAAAQDDDVSGAIQLLEYFMKNYRDADYTCPVTAKDDVIEEIVFQKRVELWGEGQSFFDIKRLDYPVVKGYSGSNHGSRAQSQANSLTTRPGWMNWCIVQSEENGNAGVRGYNNPDPSYRTTQE